MTTDITRSDFFKQVLPDVGKFCLFTLFEDKSGDPTQEFFPIADAVEGRLDGKMAELSDLGREVYFACCTFVDGVTHRKAHQALAYKCLRIDIDCGLNKPYATQKEGLKAFKDFVVAVGLPLPTIVNSGRGWHMYWAFTESVDYNSWKPIAEGLKQATIALNLKTDVGVTADGARVLRIPGTKHNKDRKNPKIVEIIHFANEYSFKDLSDALNPYVPKNGLDDLGFASTAAGADDPIMKKMLQSSEKYFSKILELSMQFVEVTENVEVDVPNKDGTVTTKTVKQKAMRSAGCAQIANIYKNRADETLIDHDLWRAGLSIAWNCVDRDKAIHLISEGYPKYTPAETIAKALGTEDKPQKCIRFQSLNPELCVNCVHKNKANPITTPITLGMTIIAATPLDNIQTDVWHEGLNDFTDVEIPSTYPRNWFRPKAGGVAMRSVDDEEEDKIVYEHDLWVASRIEDPNHGAMVEVVSILPVDGLRMFNMPQAYVAKKDKMLEVLSENHVAIHPAHYGKIQAYITDWIKYWQAQTKYRVARSHFGWHENNSKFLIGSKEIEPDGKIIYSPPCSVTEDIAPKYHSAGELSKWKQVIDTYDLPGNEARAFALFAGMGAPLYKLFNVNSMVVHLTNAASGVGKSTALMAINSFWGHPVDTMLNQNDTALSRQQRAGVLCNLPVTIDEITNLTGEEISDFIFHFSFDRGRNRMHAQSNAERKNTIVWNTVGITSGNNSLYDSLKAFKSSTQGEMFRIMEIQVDKDTSKTKIEADFLFNDLLRNNYGMAGVEFMQYVVANYEVVVREAKQMQLEIDSRMGWTEGKERNYSALCAAAFTAAEIAQRLGLHSIDIPRVKAWAVRTLGQVAENVAATSSNSGYDVLGQFFNEHIRNVLTVNDYSDSDNPLKLPTAVQMPQGELLIRYEPNTRRIFIAKQKLQSWCSSERIPYAPFWQDLLDKGTAVGEARLCLSQGTSIPGSRIWAVQLNADNMEWNVDKLATVT